MRACVRAVEEFCKALAACVEAERTRAAGDVSAERLVGEIHMVRVLAAARPLWLLHERPFPPRGPRRKSSRSWPTISWTIPAALWCSPLPSRAR
jgi:hypothetical protein